ncbi:MAG: DUF4139 domain-containing protein [Syntrophaceae bacterium]|nr:DUF4139 domain-containing protein [Syntrophaceae bacterium]
MSFAFKKSKPMICLPFLFFLWMGGTAEAETSTIKDQQSVALTIYNSNMGVVKETRLVNLPQGIQTLRFTDVPGRIDPATVNLKSMVEAAGLRVLEQNFEYDLVSQQKLLEKFVGQKVDLVWLNPESKKEETVEATLLSTQGGNIFQIGDRISLGHPGRIVLSKIPEGLSLQPALFWLLENKLAGAQRLEVTYVTSGINWKADYLAILNPAETQVSLTGSVTIENRSGASYRNAVLRLVAGEVQRVREEKTPDRAPSRMAVASMEAAPQFKEESFFEYHLYTLDRGTTIGENQIKQLLLFNAPQVPVSKMYLLQGQPYYYWSRHDLRGQKPRVGVFLEMVNRQENRLGMPLPKGTLRVYKADQEGTLQFAGEDRVDHTPRNEKFKVKIGEVFDVAAERVQTDFKQLDPRLHESTFEVTLRNRKNEDIRILVEEPIPGTWEMVSNTHSYERVQANLIRFIVPVAKGQEVKVRYKVRVRY